MPDSTISSGDGSVPGMLVSALRIADVVRVFSGVGIYDRYPEVLGDAARLAM